MPLPAIILKEFYYWGKDYHIGLSTQLLPWIRQHPELSKSDTYLIYGREHLQFQYSVSSIRKTLKKTADRTGRGYPPMLRHSYATHIPGNVMEIRCLQKLLGHTSPETTMIYTHLTTKQLTDMKSPLDNIVEKLSGIKCSLLTKRSGYPVNNEGYEQLYSAYKQVSTSFYNSSDIMK